MYSLEAVRILMRNEVKVYQSKVPFQISNALNYRTGKTERTQLPSGTYIVPTHQPRSLFINSIMERNMTIEDSVMYDMATWSLPLAYNIDAWSTTSTTNIDRSEVTQLPYSKGNVINPSAGYAYVIDWSQRNAPKALAKLWSKSYHVRSAFEPFGDKNRIFSAGTLIILKGRNREKQNEINQDIFTIAQETGVEIVGFNSGKMTVGMDLANTRNRPIHQPK